MPQVIARARLEDHHFRELVNGRIVTLRMADGFAVEVALADIGWDRMFHHVEEAYKEVPE